MATVTQHVAATNASYDMATRTYTITALYDVVGAASYLDMVADPPGNLPTAIPATQTVTHAGLTIDGVAYAETVTCYLVGRTCQTDQAAPIAIIRVTASYEGRVTGILATPSRVQMVSETLIKELGTSKAIGVAFAGAPREVPMEIYTVIEVRKWDSKWETDQNAFQESAGCVNEGPDVSGGWIPPWFSDAEGAMPEGWYLYMGIAGVIPDRRTRTLQVTHEFMRMASKIDQGLHFWYDYTKTELNGQTVYVFVATASSARIYYVAGIGPGSATFSSFWGKQNITRRVRW